MPIKGIKHKSVLIAINEIFKDLQHRVAAFRSALEEDRPVGRDERIQDCGKMRFVGALAELEDEFGQVEGEEWVQEAGAESHIFLFHLSLKDYLVIKKVLKPHVVVF